MEPTGSPANDMRFDSHEGFSILFSMSNCIDCRHVIGASTHDRCRSHADCASGAYYTGILCGVCHGLWSRARAYLEDPEDAMLAFKDLQEWIQGFVKNSKGRQPGQGVFVDQQERKEFITIRAWYNSTKRASSVDSTRSSLPSSRVSVIQFLLLQIDSVLKW